MALSSCEAAREDSHLKCNRTFPKNSGEAEGELGEVFGLV
jgi:hypothetical protein